MVALPSVCSCGSQFLTVNQPLFLLSLSLPLSPVVLFLWRSLTNTEALRDPAVHCPWRLGVSPPKCLRWYGMQPLQGSPSTRVSSVPLATRSFLTSSLLSQGHHPSLPCPPRVPGPQTHLIFPWLPFTLLKTPPLPPLVTYRSGPWAAHSCHIPEDAIDTIKDNGSAGNVLSHSSPIRLFATPCTVALQALLSVGFSRQEYWNGLLSPPLGIFLTQEWNP